ncbi:MAG: M1 family metallopeptidase, partial [Candidatus Thorarchaeota archaeon]
MNKQHLVFLGTLITLILPVVLPSTFSVGTESSEVSISRLDTQGIIAEGYSDFSQGDFSDVNLSRITLHLSLDEDDATVNGTMEIEFYNDAPYPLTRIPFHLYTSGMRYIDQSNRGIYVENVTSIGTTPAVEEFSVNSNEQVMWVNFESNIQPNEFVSLNFTFQTIMPDGQDRSGAYGTDTGQTRIYTFTGSYPMPCVYDQYDGWNTDPYLDVGDPFYFDMAFYDLYVEVPEAMVVAATGEIASVTTADGRSTYHYDIPIPVREVTFSASRYYQIESRMYNGVNVSSYFLPVTADLWETDGLDIATQSLELFNSTYGIYPYSTLNVVEQHAFYAGMEYPCQVYITHIICTQILEGSRDEGWFELTIAHEVAHQWWSQIVGDDCVDWGFLDEMLASWSHAYYAEVYYDNWEYFQPTRFLDIVRTFYAQYNTGCIINQSNYDRPDLTGYADYTIGPMIVEKLRRTVGHDTFILGIQDFLKDQYFRIAILNDLQASFEQVYGNDLDWFFMPWFSNGYLPDYAIENPIYDPSLSLLTFEIVDLNEDQNEYTYSQQIPLVITDAQGNDLIASTVWVNGTTEFEYNLHVQPSTITLDYTGFVLVQLPDDMISSYSVSGTEIG